MLAIASGRVRRLRWLVPVPVMLIQVVSGVLGRRLWIRLGLDRLNSLFELPLMDTANDLQRLGLSLRSLPSGMHPSGGDRRRRLICEGQALLTYVLKERPGTSLLRRYVRAVEKLRGGSLLDLPAWTLRLPIALALLDDRAFALSARGAEFAWRLDAATTLAEATTQGARRFLSLGRSSGALMSLVSISRAVVAEIVWRVLRIAGAPFLQRYIRDTESHR
jgi:NADH dehydrogenase